MRVWKIAVAVAAIWLAAGSAGRADDQALRNFAMLMGLVQVDRFVDTVETLRETGWLPDYYIDKREAERRGWDPGDDLCEAAPGFVLGGSHFGNFERRLPDRHRRRWSEADLDFDCGRRGARRLVFSNDGLIYVTLDHYQTFYEVPE